MPIVKEQDNSPSQITLYKRHLRTLAPGAVLAITSLLSPLKTQGQAVLPADAPNFQQRSSSSPSPSWLNQTVRGWLSHQWFTPQLGTLVFKPTGFEFTPDNDPTRTIIFPYRYLNSPDAAVKLSNMPWSGSLYTLGLVTMFLTDDAQALDNLAKQNFPTAWLTRQVTRPLSFLPNGTNDQEATRALGSFVQSEAVQEATRVFGSVKAVKPLTDLVDVEHKERLRGLYISQDWRPDQGTLYMELRQILTLQEAEDIFVHELVHHWQYANPDLAKSLRQQVYESDSLALPPTGIYASDDDPRTSLERQAQDITWAWRFMKESASLTPEAARSLLALYTRFYPGVPVAAKWLSTHPLWSTHPLTGQVWPTNQALQALPLPSQLARSLASPKR